MTNAWHEVTRRLNDGSYIRVAPVIHGQDELADWVHISINTATGQPLYTGTMRIWEALVEIPYQLDRAREFETDLQETNA